MAELTVDMVLTGCRAGQDLVLLKRYRFAKGVCRIHGEDTELAGIIKYLGRSYKAFPLGSVELTRQQEEDAHGQGQVHPGPNREHHNAIQPGLPAQQPGAPASPAADGGGATAPATGDLRGVSNGGGFADARQREQVLTAISRLDPANDDHWTQNGLPAVAAIQAILPKEIYITRDFLNVVAPEAKRPQG